MSSSHNTTSASCIYALEAYGIKDPAVKNVDTRVLALYGIVEAEFRGVDCMYSIYSYRPIRAATAMLLGPAVKSVHIEEKERI